MPDALIQAAFTTLDRAALAVIAGAAASWLWLLPRKDTPPSVPSTGPVKVAGLALLILGITGVVNLVLRSAVMGETGIADVWPVIPKVIANSQFGEVWLLRMAVWAGLLLAWLWIWRRGASLPAAALVATGGLLTAFVFSSSGHAGDDGLFALANFVNTLHIASGCVWGGAVIVYGTTVLPGLLRHTAPPPGIARTATRLSTLAGGALALVLLTGTYNAWYQINAWPALWTTDYGQVLLIKLGVVAVMMVIGAGNRFFVVPAVERWAREAAPSAPAPVQRFLKILRVDTGVFIVILACAAVLGSQTPPIHAHHDHASAAPATTAADPRAPGLRLSGAGYTSL